MTSFLSEALRILYSFPDTLGEPGIGAAAAHHVEGLARRGHEVIVYCTSFGKEVTGGLDRDHGVATLTAAGVRIPHRALGRRRAYRYHDQRVAHALVHLDGKVDVVHVWPRATMHTAAAARDLGIPTVREVPNTHTAHAYERVAEEMAKLGLDPLRGHSHTPDPAGLDLEEREYAAVDMLAVPSEYSRATFLERRFSHDRLALHRYGFDRPASRCRTGARRTWTAGSARSSSAAASLARGSTTRCRPGSSQARPSAAPSRSAATSTPGTTACSPAGSRTRACR